MTDDRDFVADMHDLLDEAIPENSDLVAAVIAAEVVAKIRANDPDLLAGYLDARAESVLAADIRHRIGSRREHGRRQAAAGAFADAAQRFATGDADALDLLATVRHVVDDAGTYRRLADMTAPDHLFVAGQYDRDAKTSAMLAAFHQAVAKRLGKTRKTGDVFTSEKYAALYRSIVGKEPAAA